MRWKFLLLTSLCQVAVQAADSPHRTALSMRDRGLLQASGKRLEVRNLPWEVLQYRIPQAHQSVDGLDLTLTYAAGYVAHAICQIACLHP